MPECIDRIYKAMRSNSGGDIATRGAAAKQAALTRKRKAAGKKAAPTVEAVQGLEAFPQRVIAVERGRARDYFQRPTPASRAAAVFLSRIVSTVKMPQTNPRPERASKPMGKLPVCCLNQPRT